MLKSGLLLIGLGLISHVAADSLDEAISARLTPVGQVCIEGAECRKTQATQTDKTTLTVASNTVSGEAIYNRACAACHNSGAAGAPKFADTSAWAPRINKGMQTLYISANNGLNGMPPKGMCPSCSDTEINAAVDYLVDSAQ